LGKREMAKNIRGSPRVKEGEWGIYVKGGIQAENNLGWALVSQVLIKGGEDTLREHEERKM